MENAADLEITIRQGQGGCYPEELRFTAPEPNGIEIREYGQARLSLDALRLARLEGEEKYGEKLWGALFGDNSVGPTFKNCRAIAHGRQIPLRLRLFIQPDDPALHAEAWELLREPGTRAGLALDQRTLFSRFLASREVRPTHPAPQRPGDVRAIVVIADPDNLKVYRPGDRELAPVDVEGEGRRAREALAELMPRELSRLARPGSHGEARRATLDNLVDEVREGCDLLYLVCHGALVEGEPVLYLETPEGRVHWVRGTEFVERLGRLGSLPRLVVLASCQSAAGRDSSSKDRGALAALGPRLVRAGVPAVLAMQGDVTMPTVAAFTPVFFRKLLPHGQIDRAIAAARDAVRERQDWWVPVLFMRLAGGNLWDERPKRPALQLTELLAYLDTLAAQADLVPGYYPPGARMERVRIRVRVSSQRQVFDRARAEERERLRRQGVADDEAGRAYRHRFSPDGSVREGGGAEESGRPRVEVLDWDRQVRAKLRRGVIVGDPGLGKTWLLKWEAARCAAEAAARLRASGDLAGVVLPVYRRLTDLAKALHTLEGQRAHGAAGPVPTLPEAVIESLRRWQLPATEREPSRGLSPQLLDLLQGRLGTEHALLLLDAFDEVPEEERPPLLQALGEWVPHNPQARVLFTSRIVGYQQPWPLSGGTDAERETELLPFDDDQVGSFVGAFFGGDAEAAQDLRALLPRAPQVRGMVQIPLLLGFLCALYWEDRRRPAAERRDLARLRRTELYEDVLGRLLSGKWKDLPRLISGAKVSAKLELLEPVAFRLFLAGREQFTLRELRQAIREAWAEVYPGQAPTEEALTGRVEEWSEQDGVLVKAGAGAEAPYLFLHLTFQEYLTARYLAHRINRGGWGTVVPFDTRGRTVPAKEFVDRRAWLPSWQEVVVLLAGSLEDPVPLLGMLADQGRDDIFRHRLALAALCLPEISGLLDQR
jgi:hypothetical protein